MQLFFSVISGSLLLVFAQTFKSIGSYALLLPLIKILLFSFPNWHALKFECQSFANEALCLWVNFPLLCTASSCVYIHPFADRSELYYYILYLIDFILDIFFLYTFTSCGDEYSILLLCKGILFSGFISLFGLINILNQKKVSKGDSTRKV